MSTTNLEYTVEIQGEHPRPLVYKGLPLVVGEIRRDTGLGDGVRITEIVSQPSYGDPGHVKAERL